MSSSIIASLEKLRNFYDSGSTRSYEFRREQLIKLKTAIQGNEKAIAEALYQDLKKSREEVYATETGLVLAEITTLLNNLAKWMRPKSVGSGLANFPSQNKIYRDPLGVTLIIGPWNYPFQLIMLPLAGAIAGGNCVALKPSELAPRTAVLINTMVTALFSPEYIICAEGEGAVVIPEMMNLFRFDHVFFTGSVSVGKKIYQMAAEKLTPVTLELGGKSPAIVEKDASIGITAKRIAVAKFVNTGQTCVAPDYLLVHRSVKDELVNKLRSAIESFYTSDAAGSYDYGRIINTKRFDQLLSYMKEGRIIAGGEYNREQLFISPTLLEDVSMDSAIMKEEIFGPILPIMTFDDAEEARKVIEQNPNPLSLYVFTKSSDNEKRWIDQISFGGGCVNNAAWHFTNHRLPFGGVGNSGIGSYHGKYSFETFTRAKSVLKSPLWFDPKIKYPSFKGRLALFKKIFR